MCKRKQIKVMAASAQQWSKTCYQSSKKYDLPSYLNFSDIITSQPGLGELPFVNCPKRGLIFMLQTITIRGEGFRYLKYYQVRSIGFWAVEISWWTYFLPLKRFQGTYQMSKMYMLEDVLYLFPAKHDRQFLSRWPQNVFFFQNNNQQMLFFVRNVDDPKS